MNRLEADEANIAMALTLSARSTCFRRAVGCVLVDRYGIVIGTGYNGVPRGEPHCIGEFKCSGAYDASGTNLDGCNATHAEINAITMCKSPMEIDTCYTTTTPCMQCVKMLMNTTCKQIIYLNKYPHLEAENLWLTSYPPDNMGIRTWCQFGHTGFTLDLANAVAKLRE